MTQPQGGDRAPGAGSRVLLVVGVAVLLHLDLGTLEPGGPDPPRDLRFEVPPRCIDRQTPRSPRSTPDAMRM
jgi:hypothetical protein